MRFSLKNQGAAASYGTLLVICCGLAFLSYTGSYMRIPVVPLFAHDLGASTVEVGLINAAFLLMAGVLSFPLGMASDRLGRKPLVTAGLCISMASALLLYFSRAPGHLIWINILFGIGLAAIGPTLMSYVADFSPATHLGRSYGWYTTAIYSGMSLGPALGGWLAQGWGFRPLFLWSAAFMLLIIVLAVYFLPGSEAPKEHPSGRGLGGAAARDIWRNRPLLGCWLATLVGCFGLGMFVTFSPLHAHDHGMSLGQIGLMFAVQAVANAVCRIPFGRLSDRVQSRGNLAALGILSFSAAMALFALARTPNFFLAAAVVLGVAMGLAFTPLGAFIAEVVPPASRGLAMGGYNTCIYLGMMLSSAFMGGVIGRLGFAAAFLLTALLIVVMSGVFYLMAKDFSPERGEPHETL